MSYLNARVLDRGLETLVRETTRLLIGPTAPADYPGALLAAIGAAVPSVVGPSNYLPAGRMVIVLEINNGVVNISGIAAMWCLVDDRGERLLASGTLINPLDVVAGNRFTLTAFEIAIPGAVAGTGTPPIIVTGGVPPAYRAIVGMRS